MDSCAVTLDDRRDSIQVFATDALGDARQAEIVEMCVAAHDSEEFRRLFSYFLATSGGGRHVLAYRGSELVSHAVVTTRWLQPDGQPELRTAYVDAVSTLPAAQGRGYGSAVMRRLAGEIDDYEIACLQTDLRGFYEPLGWELWRGDLAGREDDGRPTPTPDQTGVMVLRLGRTPALDLDAPLTIERQPDRIWE